MTFVLLNTAPRNATWPLYFWTLLSDLFEPAKKHLTFLSCLECHTSGTSKECSLTLHIYTGIAKVPFEICNTCSRRECDDPFQVCSKDVAVNSNSTRTSRCSVDNIILLILKLWAQKLKFTSTKSYSFWSHIHGVCIWLVIKRWWLPWWPNASQRKYRLRYMIYYDTIRFWESILHVHEIWYWSNNKLYLTNNYHWANTNTV